jgi:hypothetical protein
VCHRRYDKRLNENAGQRENEKNEIIWCHAFPKLPYTSPKAVLKKIIGLPQCTEKEHADDFTQKNASDTIVWGKGKRKCKIQG